MVLPARYAALPERSRGRLVYQERRDIYRDEYQRDRDRIIHSSAFRRLEYKTQVFVNHEGDMYRTRLTHSIEVAQIGKTIARALSLNEDLTEAICLAHDLGHTPFGHAGQEALHLCMSEHGGFEHNLQSLRIVDLLENKYALFPGLNLTFETREGILKYCSRRNAEKLGAIGVRFLRQQQPSLEAQVANIADEIAYNNHDIDDGLRSGLLCPEQLIECALFYQYYSQVVRQWPDLSASQVRHEVIRRIINCQVSDLIENSLQNIKTLNPDNIEDVRLAERPMISMSPALLEMHLELKRFLRRHLYQHRQVDAMAKKAIHMINTLFNKYIEHPGSGPQHIKEPGPRQIADYIAGMTDRFAIAEFNRISPNG